MKQWLRLYHTLKDLRWQQFFYRGWQPLKRLWWRLPPLPEAAIKAAESFPEIIFSELPPPYPCRPALKTFVFLNREKIFKDAIDWNFRGYGLLWTFHLNYLDWLRDETLSYEERLASLLAYAAARPLLKAGLASYPASVRLINAVRFLAKGERPLPALQLLWKDACRIAAFPEKHLLANHFLESAFAMFYAAYFFRNKHFYIKSRHWLTAQLQEQILPDGGHYERSPAYHLHILTRILQCLELMDASPCFPDVALKQTLRDKSALMLGWSGQMSLGGQTVHFGDSNDELGSSLTGVERLAERLGIRPVTQPLGESGYRCMSAGDWAIWLNAGSPSPKYQPGHAHADPLSFVAFYKGRALLTNVGVSTYEKDECRLFERSTAAHQTPVLGGRNASDVWAAFRMGRKANVTIVKESEDSVAACHDGYKALDITVKSTLFKKENSLQLAFQIKRHNSRQMLPAQLRLYFPPDEQVAVQAQQIYVNNQPVINVRPNLEISLGRYVHASGFYLYTESSCVCIRFEESIELLFN